MPLPHLKKEETALLVIDMQNDFVRQDGFLGKSGRNMKPVTAIVPALSSLVGFCRRADIRRIFIRSLHSRDTWASNWVARFGGLADPPHCRAGTWGAEIVTELKPADDEPLVTKHLYSAMLDSTLPVVLRGRGIRNLLVTGTQTNVCVDSTVRHAFMLNYVTITVSDCVATDDVDLQEPTLKNLARYFGYVAGSAEVMKALH